MDLVSFEDPEEYRHFAKMMHRDNISSVYTSGRKCNFQNKGCDADHLQPININGWFWADGIYRLRNNLQISNVIVIRQQENSSDQHPQQTDILEQVRGGQQASARQPLGHPGGQADRREGHQRPDHRGLPGVL